MSSMSEIFMGGPARVLWGRLVLLPCVLFVFLGNVAAQETKIESPRITSFAPQRLVPGAKTVLRVLGHKLSGALEVRFGEGSGLVPVRVREKKAAELPKGLEAKDAGDTQFEVEVDIPATFPEGDLALSVATINGITPARSIRVVGGEAALEEKEPNNGFREAQALKVGGVVFGAIRTDKDVDVYVVSLSGGRRVRAEIFASRRCSLLDAVLSVYDSKGRQLASSDDFKDRDPLIECGLPADGKIFVAISDAHDRGSVWHGYEMRVSEAP